MADTFWQITSFSVDADGSVSWYTFENLKSPQPKAASCQIGRSGRPCERKGTADNMIFPSSQALHRRSHKRCCSIFYKGDCVQSLSRCSFGMMLF
ncbi:hypothetical protein AVEN_227355-1 [Araneus ventricosus]|uniref:Uncharacterized protein n=1 Tax=Araneus ventricosus TaxID=182803 RepID=A0A4Y2GTK1_ARAVE|nr:hypothetical protein AVEN_227355-1 [Araneus ventricosus]